MKTCCRGRIFGWQTGWMDGGAASPPAPSRLTTHVGPPRGHEDGEVCEVVAGAGGGVGADVDGPAAPGGPAALQAVGLVLPESTFDGVVLDVDGL